MDKRQLDDLFDMIEDRLRRETLSTIHKEIDLKLVTALSDWWETQNVTLATALSVTSYFLAHTMYDEAPTEDEGCAGITAYNDYMHSAVHRLYQEYPKDGISSEPEPVRSKKH